MSAVYVAAELIQYTRPCIDTAILAYRLLEDAPTPLPGQFYMLHVPGVEAIPLSAYGWRGGTVWFLVKSRGPTSRRLVENPPRRVGLLGPLGKPLPPPPPGRSALLLAGGVGVAPLAYYASLYASILIYGVRSAAYYVDVGVDGVLVASDDGSIGVRGTVLDAVDAYGVDAAAYDPVIAAGPTSMLCAAYEWAARRGLLDRTILVLEELTTCGLGFCGDCIVPGTGGLRLCREGPGLRAALLQGWYERRCRRC